MARGWVQDHCGSAGPGREGTPARCARARAWLADHCSGRAGGSGKYASRETAEPRQRKRAHRARPRIVDVYVERLPRCCHGEPAFRYRAPRYKDRVFPADFHPVTGREWEFYAAQESAMR
jgi:hypothetical protein